MQTSASGRTIVNARGVGLAFVFASTLGGLGACQRPSPGPVPPLTVALPQASASPEAEALAPPKTRTDDVVDTIHGTRVPDPYRWLEDGASPEVRAWTNVQNAHTRAVLSAMGESEALAPEVKRLLEIGYVNAPAVRKMPSGTFRYFHTKREGKQDQPTVYVRDGSDGKDRALVDVSALSPDGTTALDWWYPSNDGGLVAWGRSDSGSEDSTLYVRDVATGKDLPDRIDRTRHASVAWLPDGKSFYYSRYPEKGTVPAGDEKYSPRIYLHTLGRDPSTDVLVFGEGRNKTDVPVVDVSPNGRFLVVTVQMGWDKSDVYVKDLSKGPRANFEVVVENVPSVFEPIAYDDRLYLKTNDGAPRYALYAVSYAELARAKWKRILPENADVLSDVTVVDGELVATYLHDAASRVERFALDGRSKGPIDLPGIGSARVTGAWNGREVFVGFSSYVVPPTVFRFPLERQTSPASATAPSPKPSATKLEPWDSVATGAATDDIEVQRLHATSKDGTDVQMFVVAKKGFARNDDQPTVLYGYGGFNQSLTPAFNPRALAVVQHGGVWVTALLRGGGEFGESWHKAGMLGRKQNVFDDLYACAEALFAAHVTRPDRLAVMGGSNGGLLVATALTQRPELFRAGLSLVPLTDMIRYHKFKIAKLWIPEYGNPDEVDAFRWLYAYSPYHHVTPGVRYPAALITTAESDSRVDPMHARKFAARLQAAQADPSRPILLRVETKAGHGAGKPVSKLTGELVDELTFVFHELGMTERKAPR